MTETGRMSFKQENKPCYVCPVCKTATFDTQTKLILHALPCKRGELQNG